MLDSMITAVDDGFSYDGIVSIPETGLEDVGRRPGLAGWLDGSVELFRTTKAAISHKFLHKPTSPINDDKPSRPNSGIASVPALQTSHTCKESSQRGSEDAQAKPDPGGSNTAGEGDETRPQEQLPRKPDSEENEEARTQENLPRKLDREENEENRPQGRLPRKLDREENEEARPQEKLPRKLDREEKEEIRPQERLPRRLDREENEETRSPFKHRETS
jgi:hypothetical protein